MTRIILDTDIGSDVDDAVALMLAARSSDIKLEGVTTAYGDTSLRAKIAQMFLKELSLESVPVFAGLSTTYLNNRPIWWPGHEKRYLSDEASFLPESPRQAIDFLIRTVLENPGEITIVAIAPFANLAMAIIREPEFAQKVKQIVAMAGVVRMGANSLNLTTYTEHNVRSDPEAASVLVSSGAPIILVPLDVTTRIRLEEKEIRRFEKQGSRLCALIAERMREWMVYMKRDYVMMHDPLTLTLSADPSYCSYFRAKVHVEYDHRHPSGQTIAIPANDGNVQVAIDVDKDRYVEMLMRRLCP